MSSDSESSPIPSPEPQITMREPAESRSPRHPFDMESSNGSSRSSCSSTAGRRSPIDEDSRSPDPRTKSASANDGNHKVTPGSSDTTSGNGEVVSCNGDQGMEKSDSESSDVDIEEDDAIEVRVKTEAKSPSKKTLSGVAVKPLRSFLIDDILNHKPKRSHTSTTTTACTTTTTPTGNSRFCPNSGAGIVRPWDLPTGNRSHKRPYPHRASSPPHSRSLPGYDRNSHPLYLRNRTSSSPKVNGIRPRSADDDSQSEASSDMSEEPASGRTGNGSGGGSGGKGGDGNSPLDALFELTNKALDRVNGDKSGDSAADHMNLFSNRQPPKKKRKSRTAFTNHQIFELEKRFLYQKYLSPADRDELAGALGLTGAQVITWFQNRRAKLKRDVEELKKDMESAKMASIHKSLLLSESHALML